MHIRINPSVTSYEIVCAMARSAPINAYFEFDAHPDHIMVYTDMLEMAINNSKPRLILTSGCGMGIVVHINIASVKARIGEIINMVFDDSVGWMGYGYGACSSALPGSEVVVQPPPSVITMPGPILSTSGEVAVSGFSPCSGYGYPSLGSAGGLYGGSSSGGYGSLGFGGGYCGGYGSGGLRRYSTRRRRSYSGSCGPC